MGCQGVSDKSNVVAQVNGETLSLTEFQSNFTPEQWKALTPEQKKEYLQQWINITLLAQAAEKQSVDKDKSVKFKLDYAKKKVLGNALISGRLSTQNISEEDMFNYYRIHQGDFDKPAMNYKVQRIYVTETSALDKVQQELKRGMKFEDAARQYSQEALGQTGGFMGSVTPQDVDSTFWYAVKSVKQFEVTVLPKDNGWFLLRYYTEEPGNSATGFEANKEEIRSRILDERKQQIYDDLLKELKSKANIYLMM